MSARRRKLLLRAAAWLLLLGPLFYLSYGAANWWASTRAHVPTAAFGWEHAIPFWPWTIFPYWSINFFYALALFLGWSKHAIDRQGARLLTVQIAAVTCFILWPLRFSFGQPAVSGAPGVLFDALRAFDQPYNQAPSLHIALVVILWDWYRHLLRPRWARAVLHGWALLICTSTLTTWQHHFIDLPTGALLGVLCVWLWPLKRRVSLPRAWRTTRDPRRLQLAATYAIGALVLLTAAVLLRSWALWLAWPAVSLCAVALNYLGLGARGFVMDSRGRMHWSARWLYGPYRAGAWLNARLWTRGAAAADEVLPGLWLGRMPTSGAWIRAGQPQIISLCAELQAPRAARVAGRARCLPQLDLVSPSRQQLQRATGIIQAATNQARGTGVLVCCALGYARSGTAVIAWLHRHGPGATAEAAEALVRVARPQLVLTAHARDALTALASQTSKNTHPHDPARTAPPEHLP